MKLVVLGLSLSSAWGNGHATTYRALLRAFAARGHEVLFLERDVPWYAAQRDMPAPDFCDLALYFDLAGLACWRDAVAQADAVIVGSYVPDGIAVCDWVLAHASGIVAFYDIDTPVTVAALGRGEESYVARRQIPRFDIYLSFTGGPLLELLCRQCGARKAVALYCSVDAARYRSQQVARRWDLSYLGTYSADRQPVLERLLLGSARRSPMLRFVVAGPQYPDEIAWPANVERIEHVAPDAHADFYSASRFTLNVTRADMVAAGYSPSVRLFEAAACATAIISDDWAGLRTLFATGEIVIADDGDAVLEALALDDAARDAIARGGHRRVEADHTSVRRAGELEAALMAARGTARQQGACA